MSISTKQSLIGSVFAVIIGLSCCWLPALIIGLGGASTLMGFAEGMESFSGVFLTIGVMLLGFGGYRYYKSKNSNSIMETTKVILQSTLTCPQCNPMKEETMPTDACMYFYECTKCMTVLKPKEGDCCVFCSYGTEKCPPIQQGVSCC